MIVHATWEALVRNQTVQAATLLDTVIYAVQKDSDTDYEMTCEENIVWTVDF